MTKNKIIIKTVFGSVLWESKKDTVREAVIEKNLQDADLRYADLRGVDLRGVDLQGVDLRGADLQGADLRYADLRYVDLRYVDLQGADLRYVDLQGADLRGVDLRGVDLRGVDLWQLPIDFINQCSRDILFIMQYLKGEVKYLKQSLIDGKVDGSSYEGECACFVGTLVNAKKENYNETCNHIPFYQKGIHNPGENWFLNIRKGDTPETNQFAAHVMKLIEMVETGIYTTVEYKSTDELLKEWEEKWKKQEEMK